MSERRFAKRPWSVPVAVAEIPETGQRIDLAPNAAIRAAVAEVAGVAGLPRLEAAFELTRFGQDGLRVVGRVSATVEQNCVVTLEPLQNQIDETVDVLFAPPRMAAPKATDTAATRESDRGEAPEALCDGQVDLGALATEFLILGIDPYPRRPGAVFDAPAAGDPSAHPFAALAALKRDSGEIDG